MRFPTTRTTLLEKLSAHDEDAWTEFFDAYKFIIRDVGFFKGLSSTECDDLLQNVMIRFSNRVEDGFRYDASLAHFHTYFNRIVKGCIYDLLRTRRNVTNEIPHLLDENTPDELLDLLLLEKWRGFLLQNAIEELKNKVDAKTFQIFDLFLQQGMPVNKVVELLQVKPAYVYLVGERCTKRLKAIVEEFNRQDGERNLHV